MAEEWMIFRGNRSLDELPDPPPWRNFMSPVRKTGKEFRVSEATVKLVNAAIYLRRPLLVTGPPGTGKSSLAHTVARELDLGKVIEWPINSRTVLKDALYRYDPIERLRFSYSGRNFLAPSDLDEADPGSSDGDTISRFLRLGPLGTALAVSELKRPKVLLIDEIDKSDIDLPNDLLHIFEDGYFEIPEISRLGLKSVMLMTHQEGMIEIQNGMVVCKEFPIVFITSNGERDLPAPFLRRCLSLGIKPPSADDLVDIAVSHLGELDPDRASQIRKLAESIVDRQQNNEFVATDQLLNAAYLILKKVELDQHSSSDPDRKISDRKSLADFLLRTISYFQIDE